MARKSGVAWTGSRLWHAPIPLHSPSSIRRAVCSDCDSVWQWPPRCTELSTIPAAVHDMTVRTLRCRGSSAHRGAFRSISLGAPTLLLAAIELLLAACGGGSSPAPPPPPPPPPSSDTLVRVSATSPFASNCDGVPANGTVYVNGEVEPSLSVNPLNPANLVGAWQEDRWSTGGAHGVLVGASSDGGKTWTRMMVPFSRCSGGNAGNGGDYERASDPWVSFSPSGTAYAMALVFSGISFAPGSSSGMRVTHSSDGGATWSAPQNLI